MWSSGRSLAILCSDWARGVLRALHASVPGAAARASNGRYPSRCPLSAGALPGVEHIPWQGCHPSCLEVARANVCNYVFTPVLCMSWDVAFRKSRSWPKPAGSRSEPACRLSGDTLSPGLLLLRSFIRSAPVLRFLALSLPLICVPRAGGRGWLRPRPSLSLAHGVKGLGMLCVVAATTVSTSGLTVVGTVVLTQRTCRPRLTLFSSALTVRSLGCLQLLPHLSVQLILLCRQP